MIAINERIPLLSAVVFFSIQLMNTAAADTLHDTNIHTRQEITVKSCTLEGSGEYAYNLGKISISEMIDIAERKSFKPIPLNEEFQVICPGATTANYMLKPQQQSDVCVSGNVRYLCSNSDNRSIGIFVTTATDTISLVHHSGDTQKITPLTLSNGVGSFKLIRAALAAVNDSEPMPGYISANYTLMIWGS